MYQNHDATLDATLQLKDAGLIAATAVTTVGGSAVTIDLGSAKFQKGRIIVDVTACEVASNDELYEIQLQGAEASAFSTAYELSAKQLGALEVTGNAIDSGIGRYVIYFDNVAHTSATVAGGEPKPMRYLRLRTVVSGTIATGINYTAWMVKDKS